MGADVMVMTIILPMVWFVINVPGAPSVYSNNTTTHHGDNTSPAGIMLCYIPQGTTGSDSKGKFKVLSTCYYLGS